jgi:hypothetical protein
MTTRSRSAALLPLLVLPLLAAQGCRSAPAQRYSHWNVEGTYPRAAYHFLGYRSDLSSSYREHQWREKESINLTARRHILNHNPDNPFQADDPSRTAPRPPHSILPNPLYYFHLESIVTGLVISAAGGPFIPIPIGSVIGTIEPGGMEEFGEGISRTFSGDFESRIEDPPPPKDFRVKNRR